MRVLHFTRTYHPDSVGGVEQVVFQLSVAGRALGIESEVLALSRNARIRELEWHGHRVHRARLDIEIASTGMSLSAFARFRDLARGADVVHYHFPWPFTDVVHLATRVGRPTVVTYHSDIIRQKRFLPFYRPLMLRFLGSVDRIVATSPNYVATSNVLQRYREKVRVIPIGVDRETYPVPSEACLARWRARAGERFFLFVGVLRYYKGLHILLDALGGTDYPVFIVGAGPIEGELKRHATRLGLSSVHFLGELPEEDKVALLELCLAVVFPSHMRSEAFGVTLVEGAMFGKPLISSEIGTGTSYVNVDGETGIVVPPGDPDAFRAAMRRLWEDRALVERMGRRAEARYRERFTAERMAASYADLYREIVAR